MSHRKSKFATHWIASLGLLVLLLVICNMIAIQFDQRVDLTRIGIHTVSPETGRILSELGEELTIEYWVSEKMPSGLQNLRRDTVDYLEEFKRSATRAGAQLKVHVINPSRIIEDYVRKKEEAGDVPAQDPAQALMGGSTSFADEIKQELAQQGIPELQGRSFKDDGFEIVPFYSALILKYLDRDFEAIPVHTNLEGLEYELVSRIAKLASSAKPVIAFFHGRPEDLITTDASGNPLQQPVSHFDPFVNDILKERFDVRRIHLTKDSLVPEEASLLIIAEPNVLTDRQRFEIERSIISGRPAMVMSSTTSGTLDQRLQFTPLAPALSRSWRMWGVETVENVLVASKECGSIEILREGPFGSQFRQPVPFNLCPSASGNGLDGTSPLTRGAGSIIFPFATPYVINQEMAEQAGIEISVLAKSSDQSWLPKFSPGYTKEMDTVPTDPGQLAVRNLCLLLEGQFPSTFAEGTAVPPWDPTEETDLEEAPKIASLPGQPGRVLLVGSADIAKYASLSMYQQNVRFLVGAIEALALDPDLAKIRAKVQVSSALRKTERSERNLVTYGNMVGIPLMLLVMFLVYSGSRAASSAAHENRVNSEEVSS
ncbi:MAG: GldG family protein [Planctomycetota bacterium]|nr:GldG family protein [Planctomycetota bacterium]